MCLERVLRCSDCPEKIKGDIYLCEGYKFEVQKRTEAYTYIQCPMYARVVVKLNKFDLDHHNCAQM